MSRETFGSRTPHAEPAWYQGHASPYYNDHHRAFRARCRSFVDEHILPHVEQWEERMGATGEEMPVRKIIHAAYQAGLYGAPWPEKYGGTPPPGGFDPFCDLILGDELSRCRSSGPPTIFGITSMSLAPILRWGSKALKNDVARKLVTGEAYASLAISEPFAGSDVAALRTTAVRRSDGSFVLSGQKKWITMAIFADFFTVLAKTGEGGRGKGFSLLLVDAKAPGVTVQRMRLQGAWLQGTSVVTFDKVIVPADRLIGEEGAGFRYVMYNFNHERYVIALSANRLSRTLLSDSIEYAAQRKTFGKRLIEHGVIRSKLADMTMRIDAVHDRIEAITFQMSRGASDADLGGPMALLKVLATRTLERCSREAAQIFGGASYVRGGVGAFVERCARDVRSFTVPGGSDEILADFSVREDLKRYAKNSKL